MRVKCINDKNIFIGKIITIGKEYEVIQEYKSKNGIFYKIVADNFNVCSFATWRFEKVEKESESKDITYRAVEKFGLKQLDIVQEEAAELIQAISKFKREECTTTRYNVLEELADMHIMLRQLEILMNYSDEEVENTITFKKQKLESYLNKRCVFDE